MTLSEKITLARARMTDVLERFGSGATVGWTGGKDSTVVLALWREVLREGAPRSARGPWCWSA